MRSRIRSPWNESPAGLQRLSLFHVERQVEEEVVVGGLLLAVPSAFDRWELEVRDMKKHNLQPPANHSCVDWRLAVGDCFFLTSTDMKNRDWSRENSDLSVGSKSHSSSSVAGKGLPPDKMFFI